MNLLYDDILSVIFNFLKLREIMRIEQICQKFLNLSRSIVYSGICNLKNVSNIEKFLKHHTFQSYDFRETELTDNCLSFLRNNVRNKGNIINLSRCKNIIKGSDKFKYFEYVILNDCPNLTDACFKNLSECKSISLNKYIIRGKKIKYFEKCKKILLPKCYIRDDILKRFNNFKNLRIIDISYCYLITDIGILGLKNCKKINICHCTKITTKGILELNCKIIIICACMQINVNVKEVKTKMNCIIHGCTFFTYYP